MRPNGCCTITVNLSVSTCSLYQQVCQGTTDGKANSLALLEIARLTILLLYTSYQGLVVCLPLLPHAHQLSQTLLKATIPAKLICKEPKRIQTSIKKSFLLVVSAKMISNMAQKIHSPLRLIAGCLPMHGQ